MGCFDYECECGGKTCIYVGGQDGIYSDVVIEVPLNDGTTVYVKGYYDSYGSVHVGEYQFYPEQFSDYYEHWIENEMEGSRSNIFRAGKIWTLSYTKSNHNYSDSARTYTEQETNCQPDNIKVLKKIGNETLKKCIPVDSDLIILSDSEKKMATIKDLQTRIKDLQEELDRVMSH